MIAAGRLMAKYPLTQRLLAKLGNAAPLQRVIGKQGPAQHGGPTIPVQDHLAAGTGRRGRIHQPLLIGSKGDRVIAQPLHRKVAIVLTQTPGHGAGLQQPRAQAGGQFATFGGQPPA